MLDQRRAELERAQLDAQHAAQAARVRLIAYTDTRPEAETLDDSTLDRRAQMARSMANLLGAANRMIEHAEADGRALAYRAEQQTREIRAGLDRHREAILAS